MTQLESLFKKTWALRNQVRDTYTAASELDEQGYLTYALNRIDVDISGDLKYLLEKIREERKLQTG